MNTRDELPVPDVQGASPNAETEKLLKKKKTQKTKQ
jgi:hypothetical protein